jgi:uncharacterized protein YgiM (DUF1202 family)
MNDKGERDTIREEKTPQGERKNTEYREKEVQFIEPFKRPKAGTRSESTTGRAVEITPQSNPESLGTNSIGSGRSGAREDVGRERRKEGERELTRDHMGRPVFGSDDIPKDPTGQEYVRQGTIADDFAAAEAKKKPQVIAATLVALVAVVAILCTMIWRISHREDENMLVDNDQVAETLIENSGQLLLAEGDDQAGASGEFSGADISEMGSAEGLTDEGDDGNSASGANATGSGASDVNATGSSVSDVNASGSGASGANATGSDASDVNASGSTATGSTATGSTATGTTATGSTASGSTATGSTASGTDASGSTASRPSGANGEGLSDQASEVAVSGQASASWPSGSGTDQAGMDHSGESGVSGQTDDDAVSMIFEALQDTVTAKLKTNLRSKPSTASDDLVVTQIQNGDQVNRIGINYDTGWSKLDVDGQTLYAVTGYLTTELEPEAAEVMATPTQKLQTDANQVVTVSGRTIQFTECDDTVSAKIRCNLRGEPSTTQGNASIHKELVYGDQVHRTGISEESGWSRVEVDGEVLYAVTSYLYTIEDTSSETTE